jgi:hypothetical protein
MSNIIDRPVLGINVSIYLFPGGGGGVILAGVVQIFTFIFCLKSGLDLRGRESILNKISIDILYA